MRILFLTKRFPQQRDLIERPYGRFYHLPVVLAALGHEVSVQLISYRRIAPAARDSSGVHWSSHDVLTAGPWRVWDALSSEARAFRPDWIIGCSDTWAGWLAHRLSRATGARLAVDAYDDFEAYMPWNPVFHNMWRRALRSADLVTAAGPQLAGKLNGRCRPGTAVRVLPMAADPQFAELDRRDCRETLSLPRDLPLIGYAGTWSRSRGSDILLESMRRLTGLVPEARLVVTAYPPDTVRRAPFVLSAGYLADERMPSLLNALDVVCVLAADTRFGRFSYPAKLYEAIACRVPVVATATAPVEWILQGNRDHLVPCGDPSALTERISAHLTTGRSDYGPTGSWEQTGRQLAAELQAPS